MDSFGQLSIHSTNGEDSHDEDSSGSERSEDTVEEHDVTLPEHPRSDEKYLHDPDEELEGSDGQEVDSPPPPPPKNPKKYFLAELPSDDPEVLLDAGLGLSGISLRYPEQNPPRPPKCLFERLKCTDKVIDLALGDHIYCNCVKCTAVLEQTASPQEREAWFEARTSWIAKARRERAVYLKEKIRVLAEEVELNAQRSRTVVAAALGLSDGEMRNWEDKGRWKEKAIEIVLEENPELAR